MQLDRQHTVQQVFALCNWDSFIAWNFLIYDAGTIAFHCTIQYILNYLYSVWYYIQFWYLVLQSSYCMWFCKNFISLQNIFVFRLFAAVVKQSTYNQAVVSQLQVIVFEININVQMLLFNNLPKFTQIVRLINWLNNLCTFV